MLRTFHASPPPWVDPLHSRVGSRSPFPSLHFTLLHSVNSWTTPLFFFQTQPRPLTPVTSLSPANSHTHSPRYPIPPHTHSARSRFLVPAYPTMYITQIHKSHHRHHRDHTHTQSRSSLRLLSSPYLGTLSPRRLPSTRRSSIWNSFLRGPARPVRNAHSYK